MALFDYLFSDFCMAIFVVIIIVYFSMKFLKEFFGVAPGQVWMATRRPPKWKDIEANAHPRLIRQLVRQAKDSWDKQSRYVWIKSIEKAHYPTMERNMKRLGKVRGYGTYQSMHLIVYRAPWRLKKTIILAPPDIILSSTGAKNLVYEGTSVHASGFNDIEYFSPSIRSKWSEEKMHEWVRDTYERLMLQVSRNMLTAFAEDLKLRAASPSALERRRVQLGKDLTQRAEVGDIESPTGDAQSQII